MTISKREFGILCDGTLVSCWTLKGENGLTAEILDYGVIIRSVVVPDKNGNPVDVVFWDMIRWKRMFPMIAIWVRQLAVLPTVLRVPASSETERLIPSLLYLGIT